MLHDGKDYDWIINELRKSDVVMDGYKWIADKTYEVYIVKLKAFNVFQKNPVLSYEFCTSDCIVEEIRRFRDGKLFSSIDGGAFFSFSYKVGQHIKEPHIIYFCRDMDELFKSQRASIKYALYEHGKKNNWNDSLPMNADSFFGKHLECMRDVRPMKGRLPK